MPAFTQRRCNHVLKFSGCNLALACAECGIDWGSSRQAAVTWLPLAQVGPNAIAAADPLCDDLRQALEAISNTCRPVH